MSATRSVGRPPASVATARIMLAVVSAYHLFIPLFTLLQTSLLRQNLREHTPAISSQALDGAVTNALTIALAVHIPLFLLTGILAILLSTAHPWTLRPATVSQVFSIGFSFISTPPFDALQPLIPVVIALSAGVITMLWAFPHSRAFFASHPQSRSSRRGRGTEVTSCRPGRGDDASSPTNAA